MSHDHNHDHEERELITLVDEQGNETLFEILLTIDGKEEFGKNYVLLVPVNAEEDENGEVEIQANPTMKPFFNFKHAYLLNP